MLSHENKLGISNIYDNFILNSYENINNYFYNLKVVETTTKNIGLVKLKTSLKKDNKKKLKDDLKYSEKENSSGIFCETCKKKDKCKEICGALNLYLDTLKPKIYKKDIFFENIENCLPYKAALSLAEMETVVIRAKQRHLLDMEFSLDDWEIVEKSDLTRRQKIILYRHYWQKKTVRIIAKEFEVSHAAIGYALQRARVRLKPYLVKLAESKKQKNEK